MIIQRNSLYVPPWAKIIARVVIFRSHGGIHKIREFNRQQVLALCCEMLRNGYLAASGKNSDIGVRFLDPDFLISSKISAIRGHLQLIF